MKRQTLDPESIAALVAYRMLMTASVATMMIFCNTMKK